MFLFELDEQPLVAKIIALSDQLTTYIKLGKVKPNWTVDELLDYYRKYDVILDKQDLYNMIKQEPMSNFITNIQGDKVTFKGQKQEPALDSPPPAPEDQKKVVKQMAQRAAK